MALPLPLDRPARGPEPQRILSDRGIRQALAQGFLTLDPPHPLEDARIQPATLDVCIRRVEESWEGLLEDVLPARAVSTVYLTEAIDVGQLRGDHPRYLSVSAEARSTPRRLGAYMANHGAYFPTGPGGSELEIGNFGPNAIQIPRGERIAQLFITVRPYEDDECVWGGHESSPQGDSIRELDMGVELQDAAALRELVVRGYLEVSPALATGRGMLVVHAGEIGYRLREVGTVSLQDVEREDLWEPFSLGRGYLVQPNEHVVIPTQEAFTLSPSVGIRFWDNLLVQVLHRAPRQPAARAEELVKNLPLLGLTDGWLDPGYQGGFSRQPKWLTGRTVFPGQPIGYGQVFYFPRGVERPYGSAGLESRYAAPISRRATAS
ncbi:MAG: hypothetical protein HY520_01300 [Candidatus Aenigmarchaeota archaeon]|nr:hypothetical protein [Candidatus Aenigmarchaeota archaeon]